MFVEYFVRFVRLYGKSTEWKSIDPIFSNTHLLSLKINNTPVLIFRFIFFSPDAGIKFVPSFCSALKELSVSDCHQVTDFGLYELAKLGALLRYLSVAKCDQVSDAGLKVIARRCYKLRYLNVRGCEAVSDDAITVLARSCARLRALDIGKCDVSDAGLRALAESCPNLKKLSLRNCDLVTDRGIQLIAYYCRGLQQLNIQDCQISADGYKAVKKYCKRCIIEHTNPGFFWRAVLWRRTFLFCSTTNRKEGLLLHAQIGSGWEGLSPPNFPFVYLVPSKYMVKL